MRCQKKCHIFKTMRPQADKKVETADGVSEEVLEVCGKGLTTPTDEAKWWVRLMSYGQII